MRLAELARTHGKPAYLIDSIRDLPDDCFTGDETVLITAGASAPEEMVQECVAALRERFGAQVESRTIPVEHVRFPLPRELCVSAAN